MTFKELLKRLKHLPKTKRTPGYEQLRAQSRRILFEQVEAEVSCEAFADGYAIYDNSYNKTVIKLQDYEPYKYHSNTLGMNFYSDLGELPWAVAVCMIGEDKIWYNIRHPEKVDSVGASDDDLPQQNFGRNPETAYIHHEFRETVKSITDKNAEAFLLSREYGYTQAEIASMLKISQQAVSKRIASAEAIIRRLL